MEERLTLNIETIVPRFIVSNLLNARKSQAVWCCKDLIMYKGGELF